MEVRVATLEAVLIEDEQAVREAISQTLELGGFAVHACGSVEQAQPWLNPGFAGVIVTDVRLPGRSGLELLTQVVTLDPDLPVIVVTGHGDVSMAVDAMRAGAYDFIEKPFAAERLMETANRAQEKRSLILENRRLKAAWAAHPDMPSLIGQSAAIEKVRTMIRSVGPTMVDILVNGQTGSGKEVVARQLHVASGRQGPFVAINCGALPEAVFESEIFGHEAGAFTSAQKRRIGKLEYAKGGTVFLDEIESMPLALQVKLLRVLQERKLERLGGNEPIAIDCRIIAASKANLLQMSAQGSFREDLYYRIGVVSIDLPRLNERREDIPLLLAHFIQGAAIRYQRPLPQWTLAQMAQWQTRDWPGNVRELRNFADRLVLGVAEGVADLTVQDGGDVPSGISLPQQVDAYERMLISETLNASGGNVAIAADRLGLPKKTLYDKIKKYQLAVGKVQDRSE
ncbi:sigma-54 dependent transcriptional regulator [Collimonas sp. OK412]|jgi:two-component system C4-dicarboxylate transport response regulator DctD|uniref:sigma-54-dependent transcriptional regulator n=1 Tax=Collimonas sp. (strain OK412) TaxID=1801619 RepID=UPI0008EFF254|nr:sigma-54 dependent transcriptional regulator [Collimonas sp. OK412]SFC88867.1 two-component system, NtrC family, C4-dicarboxylate transport response regulator DctD [Collimonas sp. OK412]